MKADAIPLKEMSIFDIYNGNRATYEVPIYQRNFAWEKDEIFALIQDVYDAYIANDKDPKKNQTYYIGTLVSFHKGDHVYEIIDGQQRLTTITLILKALEIPYKNQLTYRARKKSNDTIQSNPPFNLEEKDNGIVAGFKYVENAINEIVIKEKDDSLKKFKDYFKNNVHLIHYQVPKDIDLNHYFEIMNSRGEQLEKHEIVKAQLIEKLKDLDKAIFHQIWECCSEMNVYIQQKYQKTRIFGNNLDDFIISCFEELPKIDARNAKEETISTLINLPISDKPEAKEDQKDTFQPIIDFSNFLLIVLKLTRMEEKAFKPTDFILDDKELLNEFEKVQLTENFVKQFGFNLLKAKYLLDNYLVHHSNEDDTIESNPWKLQRWQKDEKGYLKNLDGESKEQYDLEQLLSMFEVSFTARQRKNYLFYCLLYLFQTKKWDVKAYCSFVSDLADKYFKDVYLVAENLSEINIPKPGSFDNRILKNNKPDTTIDNKTLDFTAIYGDGTKEKSKGIPLFVFNYLDYKLWKKYTYELSGKNTKKGDKIRKDFFNTLGCSDFELKVFEQFYFSRTRRSLEHYYPQAFVSKGIGTLTVEQINCLGNYAMIGSEINSSGSDWSPKAKLIQYLDRSGKIKLVSVASIKFMIMMKKCEDNQYSRESEQEWNFDDITEHQNKMLNILEVQ
jgi:hypothetical protein